jgi:hypothetical protein
MKLIPTSKLNTIQINTTAEALVDARITFVRGVVYQTYPREYDGEGNTTKYCTPRDTFNGYVADCYLLIRRKGNIFEYVSPYPIPVRREALEKIIGGLPNNHLNQPF